MLSFTTEEAFVVPPLLYRKREDTKLACCMVAILMKLIDVKITVFIFCLLCCTCFRCLKWWSKFPISPSYIIYKNKCKIYINFWKEYLLIEWFVKD